MGWRNAVAFGLPFYAITLNEAVLKIRGENCDVFFHIRFGESSDNVAQFSELLAFCLIAFLIH